MAIQSASLQTPEGGSVPSRRERILEAAVEEFAASGYAGARTASIAARAGVNAQLISYYFGSKEGVLAALRERWDAVEAKLVPPGASFAESVGHYVDATLDNANWARLVAWRALEGPGPESEGNTGGAEQLRKSLERTRRRQRDGELRDDIDAELLVLLGYLLAFAPIFLPSQVRTVLDEGEPWTGYRRRIAEQLPALVEARAARRR